MERENKTSKGQPPKNAQLQMKSCMFLKHKQQKEAFGVSRAVYLQIHNVFVDKDLSWKLSFTEIRTNFPVNNYRY